MYSRLLFVLGLLALAGQGAFPVAVAQPVSSAASAVVTSADLPLAFVANQGQWEPEVRYLARSAGMVARFQREGLRLKLEQKTGEDRLRGVVVSLIFEGARHDVRMEGRQQLAGIHNYFCGSDPARWRTGVPGYGSVAYRGLYGGVDVVFREAVGRLEYDLLVAPHADLSRAVLRVAGHRGLDIAADGSLVLRTALGDILQSPPTTWIETPGTGKRRVDCRYRLIGADRFGFEVPDRDATRPLVIDPGLDWSTFLGGSGNDYATAVAVHFAPSSWKPLDLPVVVGYTASTDFPTTNGAFDVTYNGNSDAFVAKIDHTGRKLVFATFLGGSGQDDAADVTVDSVGNVTVLGNTNSADFPTTAGAFSRTYGGLGDVFVARLAATGSVLAYSTYLGGSSTDIANALCELANGEVYVVGETQSTNFPITAGAYDPIHNGGDDVFVTCINAAGSQLVGSTFLGSSGADVAWDVGVHSALGDVTVTGDVNGVNNTSNFPTTAGAYQTTYGGGVTDAFVARLDATLKILRYSTFLGGTADDGARGLALHPSGEAAVVGWTQSSDFPTTTGAFDTSYNGSGDAYLARLNAAGGALVHSSFLGGQGTDRALSAAMDGSGAVTVAGNTTSTDFPVTKGTQQAQNGGRNDTFVCRFDPAATTLHYSSYLGGTLDDDVYALALDSLNNAFLCGGTGSQDFPVSLGAIGPTHSGGGGDAFVARFNMLPTGVRKYGFSTPTCLGPLVIGVNGMASAGNKQFAVNCYGAPPLSVGVFAIGFGGHSDGLNFADVKLHVDPLFPADFRWVYSDSLGRNTLHLPIPPGVTGIHVFCQYLWMNTKTCMPPNKSVSASNALMILVL